jgi:type I restriction enzyme M protein
MSYWNETMHDDVALIMSEGWEGAARPRKTLEDKDRKISETPDLVIGSGRNAARYKMDLIPPRLIVARYFPEQQAELDELIAKFEAATQTIEEFVKENSGDEGLLAGATDDDKINKALATARLREAKRENTDPEEVDALAALIALYEAEATVKKRVKDLSLALDASALARYGKLTTDEIRDLVIDDKWGGAVAQGIDGELAKLMQLLTDRLTILSDRYQDTLRVITAEVEILAAKVETHLAAMGVR